MAALRRAEQPDRARSGPAPARVCAYEVLRRVFERGAYADVALAAQAGALDARDRALAMRLAFGAVQRRDTLDHVIATLAERDPARLQPHVMAALRLGLYELLYLDGAPARAVVHDAVELAKTGGRGAASLVNAVLRRAGRTGAAALLGELSDEDPARAAVKHSHPEWVARMWWEELGPEEARALMAADNEPGELALRTNTLRGDADSLAARLTVGSRRDPDLPEALVLDRPFDLLASPLWQEGAFFAQSRAAMLASRALDPQPGERVLDLCAAPGGKTTHLAALMDGQGEVVAVERDRRRAGVLARNAERAGAHNVRVEVRDAAADDPIDGEPFDRVLVDPPCSGLGTLQAHPDLRWRMTEERAQRLAALQLRILAAGAAALGAGGTLVYSTCTISERENQNVIGAFLASHPDFHGEDLGASWPSYALPAPAADEAVPPARALQTLPHRDRTAGFFIARLVRG